MSYVSKLSATLATASMIVLSASAAHATVNIPKPTINLTRPVIAPVATVRPIVTAKHVPVQFPARPTAIVNKGPAIKPGTVPVVYPDGQAIKPGTVPFGNHPATSTPVASHPAPSKPAAAAPQPASKPVVLAKFEMFAAFTDQNHVVKGYYDKKGGFHDMKSPSGRSTCTATTGFSVPGSGVITISGGAKGAVAVPAVMCNTAA